MKFKLLFSFLAITVLTNAQETQLPFSFSSLQEITIRNNDIYLSDLGVDILYKFDKTSSDPNLDVVLNSSTLFCVQALETNGNDIIYSQECASDKIQKYNVNSENITEIINGVDDIRSLAINGSHLYFYSVPDNKLYKTNLNDINPTLIELATFVGIDSLLFVNDILFISGGNKVYKADTSLTTFMHEEVTFDNNGILPLGPQHLALFNNEVYLSQASDNRILKFNPNANSPILSNVVVSNSSGYQDMKVENNTIWLAKDSYLSKIDMATLSIANLNNHDISISPNPSSDFINIKGLKNNTKFKIFDINGKLLKSEETFGIINISEFSSGLYYLKIGDFTMKKIIKN